MTPSLRRTFVWSGLLLGLGSVPGIGQQPAETLETRAGLVATGANLPRHLAVEGFFEFAMVAYKAGEAAFEYNVLQELEIPARSEAAVRLEQAVLLGRALSVETLDGRELAGKSELAAERQRAYRLNRAARFGDLYRALLVDLEAQGIPRGRIEQFIDEQVAPNIFLHSTGTSDAAASRNQELDLAFERGVEEQP